MSLHILSASADSETLQQCCSALLPGDALLLCADGVYAALEGGRGAPALQALAGAIAVYALAEDCSARGIATRLIGRVQQTDYAGFVALACAQPRSVSWF